MESVENIILILVWKLIKLQIFLTVKKQTDSPAAIVLLHQQPPTFPPQEKPIGPNLFLTLIITHLIDDSPHWFAVRFHRTPGDNHLIKSLELATHLYLVVVRCHPGWEPVIILCSPDWPGLASFKVITIIIIIVTTLKLGESFTPRPTSRGRGWSHQELN